MAVSGVADPSEPNYVAMLGGSTFGISSDEPYFFPGQSVDQPNLMSQLGLAVVSYEAVESLQGAHPRLVYPGVP